MAQQKNLLKRGTDSYADASAVDARCGMIPSRILAPIAGEVFGYIHVSADL